MMSDIFSSFDPANLSLPLQSMNTSLLPLIIPPCLFICMMNTHIWTTTSYMSTILTTPINFIWSQLSHSAMFSLKGLSSTVSPLFILIIILNLMGLAPYTFSLTSHLLLTLSLALPIWFSLIMSAALGAPKPWAASLLPSGAPDWLNPFLVLVETVSILVRPCTLSFRLTANMTAGHIVLSLMSIYISSILFSSSTILISSLFLIQAFYVLFEIGICLVQAFIFCLLTSLYTNDHPAK